MGMIWNSKATLKMMARINLEFCGDSSIPKAKTPHNVTPPIKYWQANRELFNSTNTDHLQKTAKDAGIFGDDTSGSQEDNRWQIWLGKLGRPGQTSAHEDLRAAIYEGLDSTKYDEIIFTVLPIAKGNKVIIKTPLANEHDASSFIIVVRTPTYDGARLSIRTKAKKRAAKKKAAKKKAAKR